MTEPRLEARSICLQGLLSWPYQVTCSIPDLDRDVLLVELLILFVPQFTLYRPFGLKGGVQLSRWLCLQLEFGLCRVLGQQLWKETLPSKPQENDK